MSVQSKLIKQSATMKDVARLADVSTSTVSHVVNNNPRVTEATRNKVLAAIKQLNYSPSALARSLKMKQTHTIGVLLTNNNNPFFAEAIAGIEQSCYKRGYSLVLCNTENSLERLTYSMETLLQKQVDGLIILCSETPDFPLNNVVNRFTSLPIIMLDWVLFSNITDSVKGNALLGGRIATNYLIERGYRKIACVVGPYNSPDTRLFGYRQAMKAAGLIIPVGYEIQSDYQYAGGYKAMQQLLALADPPQAVFFGNDAMAIGAYKAVWQAGLSIPNDIAIIGYDDIEMASYVTPPLTTIRQFKDELGEITMNLLIARLENPALEPQQVEIIPKLIMRESVGWYNSSS